MASLNEASVSKKYVNIKMRCPQSFPESGRPDINSKEVKLIPKPVNTILPKIEVKNKNSSQTKLLSAHEKQKTSSNQAFNEEINCDSDRPVSKTRPHNEFSGYFSETCFPLRILL